jgi:hypothetical protein
MSVAVTDQAQGALRAPWNKGRLIGQKRPLKPKDLWNIRVRLQIKAGARWAGRGSQRNGRPEIGRSRRVS